MDRELALYDLAIEQAGSDQFRPESLSTFPATTRTRCRRFDHASNELNARNSVMEKMVCDSGGIGVVSLLLPFHTISHPYHKGTWYRIGTGLLAES